MTKLPKHLGIIMDGNRRWAEAKGLPIFDGHKKGADTLQKVVKACRERGIKSLTLFAFSTENWQRPKGEVNYLMNLGKKALNKDFKDFFKQGIKVRIIGQKDKLPRPLFASIKKIENLTKKNKGMALNIALSYGGRAEIAEAMKNIIRKKISPDNITEKVISQNLWTSDVDLLIRTGKEQRLSNFLIWQTAYSELSFCPKYWPDFTEKDLDKILKEYSLRQRRHGK